MVSKGTSGDGMSGRITNVCSNGKPVLLVMVEPVWLKVNRKADNRK